MLPRLFPLLLSLALLCGARLPPLAAQEAAASADYRSQHFFLHTDIGAKEARELLEKLETMLGLIADYWGRPPAGMIDCYVVRDLSQWPTDALPEAGRAKIAAGEGVTLSTTLTNGQTAIHSSKVYATDNTGVVQHEAVHAYCHMAFGRTGPVWYGEGMAEMGQYWIKGNRSVTCREDVVRFLRSSPFKTIDEIVNSKQITGDSGEAYAWRWALCHMLANNTNYAAKFRPLGLALLNGQPVTFESVYGKQREQIVFEYRFFIEHLERGLRVDLCSWDWKRKGRIPKGSVTLSSNIAAARGWQASGAQVVANSRYSYTAEGEWSVGHDAGPFDANGDMTQVQGDRPGQLVGVLLKDFQLSEPFVLGTSGSFTAPSDGTLYLRCQDAWHELADNKGQIKVKLKLAE